MLGGRDHCRSQSATTPGLRAGRNAAAAYNNLAAVGAAQEDRNGDHHGAENDGSKDESFFEARPWLDSDSDDDFYSVRGDFTPSRGSIPDHQRRMQFSGRIPIPVDRPKPPPVEKKQRLLDLLQEKQHYDDDDDDTATYVSGDMENSTVHAQDHVKPARKGGKAKKPSKSGCFPNLIWKHTFRMCRSMKTEQRTK